MIMVMAQETLSTKDFASSCSVLRPSPNPPATRQGLLHYQQNKVGDLGIANRCSTMTLVYNIVQFIHVESAGAGT